MLRVVLGFSMAWQLTVVYSIMIALSRLAPAAHAPLAYDAGSVTTGVLSGPVVLALALGVSIQWWNELTGRGGKGMSSDV